MPERDDTAPASPDAADASRAVSLLQIALLFGRVGLTSFGGGLSAWIYREVVSVSGWLSEEEFLGALTLSQILPGSNVINLSIYLGQRLRGGFGSVTAVAALLVPPMVTIVLLASVLHRFTQLASLHDFLEGVAVAAIGMTVSMGVRTARALIQVRRWPLALIAAVFAAVGVFHWPLVPVALAAAAVGLVLAWRIS
jgi:chromate transporter